MNPRKIQKILGVLFAIGTVMQNHRTYAETWTKTTAPGIHLTELENTPWGIAAGENDSRVWLNPHNGVYFSADFGKTWRTAGLPNTGVTDLHYSTAGFFVSTYYNVAGRSGIYRYSPTNKYWVHLGPSFSTSKVFHDGTNLFAGGYSHGLYMSTDGGSSWTQAIGTGIYGPEIKELGGNNEVVLASTSSTLYKSTDHGLTWTTVDALVNAGIGKIISAKTILLAGTYTANGLFRSTDNGITWAAIPTFNLREINNLTYNPKTKTIFVSSRNPTVPKTYIHKSNDLGVTWADESIPLATGSRTTGLVWQFSYPNYLFVTFKTSLDLYKLALDDEKIPTFAFLDAPWETATPTDLIYKIYSFFDHAYPLLGYYNYSEPTLETDTTTNYYNFRATSPYMYYSSHNGTDYALPYGTDILAAAEGQAVYTYCGGCGNTIKIDHANGYQTTYMHLQKTGLITNTVNTPVPVSVGQKLGDVGMTGNTTGPHLHFEVTKDTDADGVFYDELPWGKVDPYGWQEENAPDPWATFSWMDMLGTHVGSTSLYNWNNPLRDVFGTTSTNQTIVMDNISVGWGGLDKEQPLSFKMAPTAISSVGTLETQGFVSNSSAVISAWDPLGNESTELLGNLVFTIQFTPDQLVNINAQTLKVVLWDGLLQDWVELPTTVDLIANTATTSSNKTGLFGLYGSPLDTAPPTTEIFIAGQALNGWYVAPPNILFSTDEDAQTFYTLEGELGWEKFVDSINLAEDGVTKILFKSIDSVGNVEPMNNAVVQIDISGHWKSKIVIKNTTFATNE